MLYHCFASFKQSQLDFFKLVDSQLILMPLYDSKSHNQWISPITSGLLGSRVRKSEVMRFGLLICCIQDVSVHCRTERQNYYMQCVW